MKRGTDGILRPYHRGKQILKQVPELTSIADVSLEDVANIDSSNVKPSLWLKLAKLIYQNQQQFDGFVVTHGTDTLAYTACALSFALQNFSKPIVFTRSQRPLEDIPTDGRNNLLNAFLVAVKDNPQIMVVFGSKILLGVRATKISESNYDAFDSPMVKPIGAIALELRLDKQDRRRRRAKFRFKPEFNHNILLVEVTPGLGKETVKQLLSSGVEGIIVKAYGPGNFPDSLLPAVMMAREKKIPLIVLSQCYRGTTQMQLYEVGDQALRVGAIPGNDMTTEAAATKLMWELANIKGYQKLRRLFAKNLVGEVFFDF